MKQELCRPCAIFLSSRGKTVKPVYGRCEKITCAECGRRRFGYTYEVTGRATRGKKEAKQTCARERPRSTARPWSSTGAR